MTTPHANPIDLSCARCGFAWTNTIWLPLDARRLVRLLQAMCECPRCHAGRRQVLCGHPSAAVVRASGVEPERPGV